MKHKENIIKLREQGFSYREIVKALNCTLSTVSYHCGDNQKQKFKNNREKRKKSNPTLYKIRAKISCFKNDKRSCNSTLLKWGNVDYKYKTSHRKRLLDKCREFCSMESIKMSEIQLEDILEKFKTNPTCDLTGRPLDINDTNSWHLDHIIPSSKGGNNSLENCSIVCKEANQAKSGLLQEDFIQLCLDVVKHHGYKVYKSNTEDR